MSQAAPFLAVAKTALGAFSSIKQGNAQKKASDEEAKQIEMNAIARYATGTREAYEATRAAKRVESNARAAQASSGGVSTDEGALEQRAKIASEGNYNALASIYDATVEAKGEQRKADATRREGRRARTAGRMGALSTVISGASDVWAMKKKPTNG